MSTTQTIIADGIREYVTGAVISATTASTPLTNKCTRVKGDGDYYKWLCKYARNASTTTYAEGADISAAGNMSIAKAILSKDTGYFRTIGEITGHAIDACRDGYVKPLLDEVDDSILMHNRYKEGVFITSFEGAVDSAGSYGGLTRATVGWASHEEDIGSSALTLTDVDEMWDALAGGTIEAPVDRMEFFCNQAELRTVSNLVTPASNRIMQYVPGAAAEASGMAGGITYMGRPFNVVNGMTNNYLILADPANMKIVDFREIQVEVLAKTKDNYVFSVTSASIFVHENPRFAGKIWT